MFKFNLTFVLLVAVLLPMSAQAQDYVAAACRASVQTPTFDHATHRAWYRRFWTGECQGLPFFGCTSGSPNWNSVTPRLLARMPASARTAATPRVCRLGQRVGHEWARDNNVRRIDNNDLQAWSAILEQDDALAALATVEARSAAKLGDR